MSEPTNKFKWPGGVKPKALIRVTHRPTHDLVTYTVDGSEYGSTNFDMTSAFNKAGHYIGDPKSANNLARRGIAAELADPSHNTCSIGYSAKDGKWYGWSHRAICGYKGRNAKQSARRFAKSVS